MSRQRMTCEDESTCDQCGSDIYVGMRCIVEADESAIYCSEGCADEADQDEARHVAMLDDRGRQALGHPNLSEVEA